MEYTTIEDLYQIYLKSNQVSIDSRTVKSGDLFFALKGPNFDGHQYLESAIAKGATACIIDDKKYASFDAYYLVDDVQVALQDLARYHRLHLQIPVLGLTGSNGKTTTKELTASVLSETYNVVATKGNLNNHLGVPLSILSIDHTHDIAIIEMGANHIGEISFLASIAMPTAGLITNIGKAHLEGFGSEEGVRIGKTELYNYLRNAKGQIIAYADDDKIMSSLREDDEVIFYSNNEVKITSGYPYLKITYSEDMIIDSHLTGVYNMPNILAAITVGLYFDVPKDKIAAGLDKYQPSNNRSQISKTSNNKLILDAYNANPSSMHVSILNLAQSDADNKVLIIGHMLELGDSSKAEHSKLIELIKVYSWDAIFLVGSEFSQIELTQNGHFFENTNDLKKYLVSYPLLNKTILLKGSRGIALEEVIPML